MAAARLRTETRFLREFAKSYFTETAFTPDAERDMRLASVSLVGVHQALQSCVVVDSEKEDAEGARWTVEGKTVEDISLCLRLDVYCNHYRVTILNVWRLSERTDD
jgi:hypothetical protein